MKGPDDPAEEVAEHLPLASVLANLPELVLSYSAAAHRTAVIIEDERTEGRRYVQLMTVEEGRTVVECVSNHYLPAWCSWDLLDELTLLEAGFQPPEIEARHPNWWSVPDAGSGSILACQLASAAFSDVFKLAPEAPVTLRQRRLRRRGDAR